MMTPETGGVWIIFGGAFDPVHIGHLRLASEIRRVTNADGILYLPSFIPPHKPQGCIASFDDRVSMLRLALEDDACSFVSLAEASRPDENYTLNTVRALKRQYPKCEFSFLVGADNLPLIAEWYRPDELLDEVRVLVGARRDEEGNTINIAHDERITYIDTPLCDISSTGIRQLVAKGGGADALASLVPEKVIQYIEDKRLYR